MTNIDPSRFPIVIRFSLKSTNSISFFIAIFIFIYIINKPSTYHNNLHGHVTFKSFIHMFNTAPVLVTISFMILIALPVFLLYVLLILCTMQITLDKDTITYKNCFIKGLTYRYDEIEIAKVIYGRGGKFLELIPRDKKKIIIQMGSLSKEDWEVLGVLFKDKIVAGL